MSRERRPVQQMPPDWVIFSALAVVTCILAAGLILLYRAGW